jgi:hypothetical protein
MKPAVLLVTSQPPEGFWIENWISNSFYEMKQFCLALNLDCKAQFTIANGRYFEKSSQDTELILRLAQGRNGVVVIHAGSFFEQISDSEVGSEFHKMLRSLREHGKIQQLSIFNDAFPYPRFPLQAKEKIWRYVDLPKFIDLIQCRQLHFTRLDTLQSTEPHEGKKNTRFMSDFVEKVKQGQVPSPQTNLGSEQFVEMQNALSKSDGTTQTVFINCWHISEFENFAMWKIYGDIFGLSIESDYASLRSSFVDQQWSYYRESSKGKILIGAVTYYDDTQHWISRHSVFSPIMHKRNEFSYEQELRCVIWDREGPDSIRPEIDISKLIKAIHISPFAPDWYEGLIRGLCTKYNLNSELVVKSALKLS